MTTIVLLGGQFGDEGKGEDKSRGYAFCWMMILMESQRQAL